MSSVPTQWSQLLPSLVARLAGATPHDDEVGARFLLAGVIVDEGRLCLRRVPPPRRCSVDEVAALVVQMGAEAARFGEALSAAAATGAAPNP